MMPKRVKLARFNKDDIVKGGYGETILEYKKGMYVSEVAYSQGYLEISASFDPATAADFTGREHVYDDFLEKRDCDLIEGMLIIEFQPINEIHDEIDGPLLSSIGEVRTTADTGSL